MKKFGKIFMLIAIVSVALVACKSKPEPPELPKPKLLESLLDTKWEMTVFYGKPDPQSIENDDPNFKPFTDYVLDFRQSTRVWQMGHTETYDSRMDPDSHATIYFLPPVSIDEEYQYIYSFTNDSTQKGTITNLGDFVVKATSDGEGTLTLENIGTNKTEVYKLVKP